MFVVNLVIALVYTVRNMIGVLIMHVRYLVCLLVLIVRLLRPRTLVHVCGREPWSRSSVELRRPLRPSLIVVPSLWPFVVLTRPTERDLVGRRPAVERLVEHDAARGNVLVAVDVTIDRDVDVVSRRHVDVDALSGRDVDVDGLRVDRDVAQIVTVAVTCNVDVHHGRVHAGLMGGTDGNDVVVRLDRLVGLTLVAAETGPVVWHDERRLFEVFVVVSERIAGRGAAVLDDDVGHLRWLDVDKQRLPGGRVENMRTGRHFAVYDVIGLRLAAKHCLHS